MLHKMSWSKRTFNLVNYMILSVLAALCFLPILHILAMSLSSKVQVSAGNVFFWPKEFTFASYLYVASQGQFVTSMITTLERVALGTIVNMLLTLLIAYPLSKETREFRFRTAYVWYFVFTILFGGGPVVA